MNNYPMINNYAWPASLHSTTLCTLLVRPIGFTLSLSANQRCDDASLVSKKKCSHCTFCAQQPPKTWADLFVTFFKNRSIALVATRGVSEVFLNTSRHPISRLLVQLFLRKLLFRGPTSNTHVAWRGPSKCWAAGSQSFKQTWAEMFVTFFKNSKRFSGWF